MAVHTVDPDKFTEDEQRALRTQVERLLEAVGKASEEDAFWKDNDNAPSVEQLKALLDQQEDEPCLTMPVGKEDVGVTLCYRVATLMLEILSEVAHGHSVSIGTEEEELTTSEAAELLNLSRPHLVKLLEDGEIPFHKVGTHRRV